MAGTSTMQGEGSNGELFLCFSLVRAHPILERTLTALERLAKENTFE